MISSRIAVVARSSVRRTLSSVPAANRPIVGIFGVPEDRNSSFIRGPSQGPKEIRAAFDSGAYNGHCELGFDVRTGGHVVDHGDLEMGEHDNEQLMKRVDAKMESVIKAGHIPLALGGDHSVTYPLVKALRRHRDRPFAIVHFDAHPDIYHAFEGNRWSHASPFARIMESTDPELCCKLLQIGIRTATQHQRDQMKRFKSKTIDAKDFPAHGSDMK